MPDVVKVFERPVLAECKEDRGCSKNEGKVLGRLCDTGERQECLHDIMLFLVILRVSVVTGSECVV